LTRAKVEFGTARWGLGGGGMRAGGGGFRGGGGGFRGGGGGGFRGGGGGGFRGGGGRRSDVRLKHDIALLGRLDSGLGFYRFSYNGSHKAYVGVLAQEVQTVMPEAVARGRDGYLSVYYDKLGVRFERYDRWVASGARIPTTHITAGMSRAAAAGGHHPAARDRVNARYQSTRTPAQPGASML
jgi:Chaperone of endosialidase